MPARAMTVDLIVNICLVLFVGNILGILFASNLGYMCAVFFALTGFILLRRDRPKWPRPIKLGPAWIGIAGALAVINLGFIVIGASNPGIAGYGGTTEQIIGFGILALSLVLFFIRRVIQDGGPLRLRERTPATPEEAVAMASESPLAAPAPALTDTLT
jgi:amino acid transporter